MRTRVVVIAVLAVLGTTVIVQSANPPLPGNQIGYEPDQPVLFSHLVHAGDLRIPCLYCHGAAEKSRHAGVPSGDLCMGCHQFVTAPVGAVLEAEKAEDERAKAEGREPKPVRLVSTELAKLYRAMGLDDQLKPVAGLAPEPLSWVRVHNLPDHVYFDHRAHVGAGIDCATCHGPVEGMLRVRQFADLSMGWCVNCHRQSVAAGTLPNGRPSEAATDCFTCHH